MATKKSDKCSIALTEALPNDPDAQGFLKELEDEADYRASVNSSKTRAQHFADVVNEAADAEAANAARNALAVAKTIEARQSAVRTYRDIAVQLKLRPAQAISKTVEVMANDVIGVRSGALGSFALDLESNDLDRFFGGLRKNDVDAVNVLKEIGELSKGRGGKPGISGSKEAQTLAKLFQKNIDAFRTRQKALGIRVDDLYGRMLRQAWYPDSLRRFGSIDDFVDAMLPRIDRGRTFRSSGGASDEQVRDFLRKFWRERVRGPEDDLSITPRTLIKERDTFAQTQLYNRKIFLNSAEDSLFVLKNFGDGEVAAALVTALQQAAGKTRMAELFGVNPRNMVEHMKRVAKRETTDDLAAEIDSPGFNVFGRFGDVNTMLDIADGAMDFQSKSPNLKLISHGIGNLARIRYLGGVILSAFPDVATINRASARIGLSGMQHAKTRADVLFGKLDPKTKKLVAAAVDTANSYNLGAMAQRVASNSVLAWGVNKSTNWSNWIMKWGGINRWTAHNKTVAYVLGSSGFSKFIGTPFEQLDRGMQNVLTRGGVRRDLWDKLKDIPGSKYTDSQGNDLFDIEAISAKDSQLGSLLENMLVQFSNEAVPTPGVRERVFLTQGLDSGTIPGVMVRSMTSLLGYPITFMTRQMGAEMDVGGAKGRIGMGKLAASAFIAGYISLYVNDLANGRTRDYLSDDLDVQKDIMTEAFTRGGMGGWAASFLVDAFKYGSPLENATNGAPAQTIDRLYNGIFAALSSGVHGDIEKAFGQFAQATRPFIAPLNIPQTKLAFDTLVYQPFLDATDPDALRRAERNWERRTDGEFNVFRP